MIAKECYVAFNEDGHKEKRKLALPETRTSSKGITYRTTSEQNKVNLRKKIFPSASAGPHSPPFLHRPLIAHNLQANILTMKEDQKKNQWQKEI